MQGRLSDRLPTLTIHNGCFYCPVRRLSCRHSIKAMSRPEWHAALDQAARSLPEVAIENQPVPGGSVTEMFCVPVSAGKPGGDCHAVAWCGCPLANCVRLRAIHTPFNQVHLGSGCVFVPLSDCRDLASAVNSDVRIKLHT